MQPETSTSVLIVGSGPNALEARVWDRGDFTHVVAINNAFAVRPDWDFAIFPEDFPPVSRPAPGPGQRLIEARHYIPEQNRFGGIVYAGGTMAFTAGYWVLGALRPDRIAFIGCDMVYPATGRTHFYGTGTADPLRRDVTLQSLEAKSARLALLAARAGCRCENLSQGPSRLLFPRALPRDDPSARPVVPHEPSLRAALAREAALGYRVPSGRYWDEAEGRLDAAALRAVDRLWLIAHHASVGAAAASEPSPRTGAA